MFPDGRSHEQLGIGRRALACESREQLLRSRLVAELEAVGVGAQPREQHVEVTHRAKLVRQPS